MFISMQQITKKPKLTFPVKKNLKKKFKATFEAFKSFFS